MIMHRDKDEDKKRALLVGVYKGSDLQTCHEHLDELEALADTFGFEVLDKFPCHIRKFEASTLITKGKLDELVEKAKELKVDVVVFDDEIAPSQQRNLEKMFQVTVMDRTELIIDVFAQRAHTKEAHLQVELAQARYMAPRLKRLWTHLPRQAGTAGAGAYLKGAGEKQIEVDKRLLQSRTDTLKRRIEEVKAHRDTQRVARERSGIPVFAFIGYTNAGKSTLLNAMTDAGVFVEDKLFATLDTTTRKFTLNNNQEILLSDTVGFIRKLPHLLIAAFRSTLEEAIQADILIHLIDSNHPQADEHAKAALEVLKELDAEKKPIITVLNKVDLCENSVMLNKLRIMYPKTVQISAKNKTGFDELQDRMIEELQKFRKTLYLRIPQRDYAVVSEIIRKGHVLDQDYEENDVILKVDLPADLAGRLSQYTHEAQ